MRVLHLYSGNLYGGVESMLGTMARAGASCPGLDQEFALCFEGRLAGELAAAGVPVHQLGPARARRPLAVWRARRRLRRLLRATAIEAVLVHSTWPVAIFGPVLRPAGLPVALWLHNPPREDLWTDRRARATVPAVVIANSRFTAASAGRLYPGVRTVTVYPPVEPPRGLDPSRRTALRASLGASLEDVVVLQASRLEPWKGHALHLAALGRLKDVPGWTAWIAGGSQRSHEARYVDALERQAARAGIGDRVRFLGERADVAALMAAADLYCQPNTEPEPFGIAFVEAMSAGTAVIATNAGGVTEIVDASCGLSVSPGDDAALAGALERLIRDADLRRRLGAAGPARARALTDPVAQLTRVRDLLSGLVPDAGAR